MRDLGEITGPRGWRPKSDEPKLKHTVDSYGSYAFVWVIVNGEAKSAIYKDGKFLVNGVVVDSEYWMDYDESTETRPKVRGL